MKDYYKILQVSPDAEERVIRASYKALAQHYHPDKFSGDIDEATTKMEEINEANEVLTNPERRMKYDDQRSSEDTESQNIETTSFNSEVETGDKKSQHPRHTILKGTLFIALVFGVFFGVRALGSDFFYTVLSKITYYSGWAAFIIFILFALASIDTRKKDGRFRTGYKNNEAKPPSVPWRFFWVLVVIYFISNYVTGLFPAPINIAAEASKLPEQKQPETQNPAAIPIESASKNSRTLVLNDIPHVQEEANPNKTADMQVLPQNESEVASEIRPSFDCEKASSRAEKMICASKELADADRKMADAFELKKQSVPFGISKKQIKREQSDWIAHVRDVCSDEACLFEAYQRRIESLSQPSSTKKTEPCPIPGYC